MPTKQELLKAHVATLMATGMAHEYNPETIATRAFIDGYEAAVTKCADAYANRDVTTRQLFTTLEALYTVLRNRHHGRMPDEVQKAYDAADTLLRTIKETQC